MEIAASLDAPRSEFGVDNLGADPQGVRAALAQVELDRDLAARGGRGTAAMEYTQATLAVQEADGLDERAAGTQIGPEADDNGDRSANTSRSYKAAARLELQAREYEHIATQGETPAALGERQGKMGRIK